MSTGGLGDCPKRFKIRPHAEGLFVCNVLNKGYRLCTDVVYGALFLQEDEDCALFLLPTNIKTFSKARPIHSMPPTVKGMGKITLHKPKLN